MDFNCFSKWFVHGVNNLSFRFGRQIEILREGKPAKLSQRRKMLFEIPVRRGRWKPPEKEIGFVIVAPSKTILASARFLWVPAVDTECFCSSNRAACFAPAWF
jgi:hypothetical protein